MSIFSDEHLPRESVTASTTVSISVAIIRVSIRPEKTKKRGQAFHIQFWKFGYHIMHAPSRARFLRFAHAHRLNVC